MSGATEHVAIPGQAETIERGMGSLKSDEFVGDFLQRFGHGRFVQSIHAAWRTNVWSKVPGVFD